MFGRAALLLALLAATVAGGPAIAQPGPSRPAEPLRIEGDIRVRFEALDGQFRPGRPESDHLFSSKTRIFAEYDAGPIRLGGEVVDARGYGQDRNSSIGTTEINTFEPIQAYASLDLDEFGKRYGGSLKVGRFTMEVGSIRLIGRQEFPNSPSTYTGAVLDMTTDKRDRLVAFWTMPNTRLPDDAESLRDNEPEFDRASTDLQFFGASFARSNLFPKVRGEVYAYRLEERDSASRPTRNRRFWTYGARLDRAPGQGPFDFDIEAILQSGSIRATAGARDVTDLDLDAHFLHAEIGKRFARPWTPRIVMMVDVASGDGRNPATWNRFDGLFGPRRPELGPPSLYGPLARSNLVSAGFRLEGRPDPRTDFWLVYRANWLEADTDSFSMTGVRDPTGRTGGFAGHQLEGRWRYWLVPQRVRLEAGGAYLAKGTFLHDAPNAPDTGDTVYGYMSSTVSF